MIFLFGGGGGFLGNVFKGLLQPFTGPEKVDKNQLDASKAQDAGTKSPGGGPP